VVIGVSKDPVETLAKFKDQHKLHYTLLSDPDHVMSAKYGAWREKTMYGKTAVGMARSTVIVDEKGNVMKIFPNVKVDGHVEKVLACL
jgi:peroxiredoxin Q/BCP